MTERYSTRVARFIKRAFSGSLPSFSVRYRSARDRCLTIRDGYGCRLLFATFGLCDRPIRATADNRRKACCSKEIMFLMFGWRPRNSRKIRKFACADLATLRPTWHSQVHASC
jgi:hypothetical protein